MTASPRLYFSFRSPFSWLLIERMRRSVPGALERIEMVPYWEPDERTSAELLARGARIRYTAMSKAKHLYILQDTKRLATGLGLAMRWPVDTEPWWELSHLGWLHARRRGAAGAFYEAVVTARWGRGEDISRPEVIGAAAGEAGLDPAETVAAVEDPAIREEAVACLARADDEDVFGVPYLRVGWQRFWGYDRLDAFLAAWPHAHEDDGDRALDGVPAGVLQSPGMYDPDTAGGCG